MKIVTRSLRNVRFTARLPRIALALVGVVFCAAGVRATFAPAEPPPAPPPPRAQAIDETVRAFAESFARDYLTWSGARADDRERRLRPYLAAGVAPGAGVEPGRDSKQRVRWTAVSGARREGQRTAVTVVAQTTTGPVQLVVPIGRDGRGFLGVVGYPALVGPAPVSRAIPAPTEDEVADARLRAVATRAVTNYLAGNGSNLLADLTPDAVVSLPARRLRVGGSVRVTWARAGWLVAVELEATDADRSSLTLRYELGVVKRDRWYVRSLQADPTGRGS